MDKEYLKRLDEATKNFDANKALQMIYGWLDKYLIESNTHKVVVGISGGKDSTVVAAILANKLGKDNVIGVLMPNGTQADIRDSYDVVNVLGIKSIEVNIEDAYNSLLDSINHALSKEMKIECSGDAEINIGPRVRMSMLYAIGQSIGARVAGTGNLSERTLGYFTKFGDGASDFNIIGNFTSLEVMKLGEALGLPKHLIYKTPADGLSGQSDEERIGISYIDVHYYLRGCPNNDICMELSPKTKLDIARKEKIAKHKNKKVPMVPYSNNSCFGCFCSDGFGSSTPF